MTTPADNGPDPTAMFVSDGAPIDPKDLPPEVRASFAAAAEDESLPIQIRDAIKRSLGLPRHAAAEPSAPIPSPEDASPLWDLLDGAFGHDAHLWNAGRALFALAQGMPELQSAEKLRALDDAHDHIARSASNLRRSTMGPEDQLVERFRIQLDGF